MTMANSSAASQCEADPGGTIATNVAIGTDWMTKDLIDSIPYQLDLLKRGLYVAVYPW